MGVREFATWAAVLAVAGSAVVARPTGWRGSSGAAPARAVGDTAPRYVGDSLVHPEGYERWVLAGASMGLGYSAPSGADGAGGAAGMFHNVYLEPTAYEHYVRTGRFREQTMLAMTLYTLAQKVHPSTQGFFEGELLAVEVALKDSERYPGSWAYFNFGKGGLGSRARAMPREACQSCHVRNAADDNVFVQFYPTLRAVSTRFGRPAAGSATGTRP